MPRTRIPIILAAAVALGCTEQATGPTARSDAPPLHAEVNAAVAHRVTVGGPDACFAFGARPGCDANYSLLAIQWADGRVSGQYTDRLTSGNGTHAVVDCLHVIGKDAWISGVITTGTNNAGTDLAGHPVLTRVRDVGTSMIDPPDLIGFTLVDPARFGIPESCTAAPNIGLFPAPQGQVVVVD